MAFFREKITEDGTYHGTIAEFKFIVSEDKYNKDGELEKLGKGQGFMLKIDPHKYELVTRWYWEGNDYEREAFMKEMPLISPANNPQDFGFEEARMKLVGLEIDFTVTFHESKGKMYPRYTIIGLHEYSEEEQKAKDEQKALDDSLSEEPFPS